jgi:hypothetical protein
MRASEGAKTSPPAEHRKYAHEAGDANLPAGSACQQCAPESPGPSTRADAERVPLHRFSSLNNERKIHERLDRDVDELARACVLREMSTLAIELVTSYCITESTR